MALFHDVLNCFPDAMFIFDADVPDKLGGWIGVAKNQRYPSVREFRCHTPVHRGGNDRDATDVALPQLSHDHLGPFPVVFGIAKEHVKSAAPRRGLIAPDDLGKERIGYLRNDEDTQIAA